MFRRCRLEDVADMVVGRDPVHSREGQAVGASGGSFGHPLVGREGGGLGEEHREGRHADIGDAAACAASPAQVRQFGAALAQGGDIFVEDLHGAAGIEVGLRRESPISGKGVGSVRNSGGCCLFKSPGGRTDHRAPHIETFFGLPKTHHDFNMLRNHKSIMRIAGSDVHYFPHEQDKFTLATPLVGTGWPATPPAIGSSCYPRMCL